MLGRHTVKSALRPLVALRVIVAGSALAHLAEKPPFSDYLQLELVSDSIWATCKLKISIEPGGKGSSERECKSDGVVSDRSRAVLSPKEVEEIRVLVRGADLFQGQFWGPDHRGLDFPLVSLFVSDGSRAATLMCFKNPSFEVGGRKRLLDSLTARLYPGRQGAK